MRTRRIAAFCPRALRPIFGFLRRHPDLVLLVTITLLGAALRLWRLGEIPQGIHGDEAQVGLDARRVLDHGWIGVYTRSALGQPAGHAYLTAPAVALLGSTPLAVRLPLALTGVAAIPLDYILFRLLAGRTTGAFAALLLALSLWHIHFSRVAHWPVSSVTVALGVLVLWVLALQRGRWYWFALAGALLGLGLFTYNVYPIFVIAFAAWVLAYTLLKRRKLALRPWLLKVGLAAAVSVLVGMPLFVYMADPSHHYFAHYHGYYDQYSVLQSAQFRQADLGGKVEVIGRQVGDFLGAYVWRSHLDLVDASTPDGRPMLDAVSVALIVAGLAYAAWRWRETPHLMCLTLVAIIPLASVLQTNATFRGPLMTVPLLCFFAALPLSLAWRAGVRMPQQSRAFAYGGLLSLVALIGFINVYEYFGLWAKSYGFPFVYAEEISAASQYAESLPGRPYVYFFSDRWSFDYETRQYLAGDVRGEDRSSEFGLRQDLDFDRSRDSLVLLLGDYKTIAPRVEERYPDSKQVERQRDGRTLFIGYLLPAIATSTPASSPSSR